MSIYIDTEWASLAKAGEELCGDHVEVVRTAEALVAVLADGLGSGVKANILSTLTAKIIATMVKNGATLEETIETISHTLPICQKRNLAYSTFTIIQITREGQGYVVEFDNPSLFFVRAGKLSALTWQEREIDGLKIRESKFQVMPGDLLVTVSDGVVHAGIGGVLNLGWQWEEVGAYIEKLVNLHPDAQTLSKWLITACGQLYASEPGDDTTALVLKIRTPRTLTVAVGPPQHREDDVRIAQLIREEPGSKVICGGTTGSIIAREWGTDIKVNLKDLDPEVPPYGRLRGVDLVTEGIITLSKTLEALKKGETQPEGERKNAVSLLSKLLLDSDKIQFLVGKAINPAHQNPDLPLNLALKMQVVKEIAETLEERGKKVDLLYF
ncbi:MAG TPA: serine/threonine protein phosphatase [Firmicutes bacterium]|nr:serine/threonine protein phosphatase [Bacillota bacterium]